LYKTFLEKTAPDGLDIQNFKDVGIKHLEDLKAALMAGGGKSKSS